MGSDQAKKSEKDTKGRHGEIVELHGTQTHIAKSKKALEQSRKDWEITFNAMSDWVVLTDLEGRILRTNRAGEDFIGKSSTEIFGQTCCKLIHGSDKHLPGCPLHRMIETCQHESIEFLIQDTDRWLTVSTDPVINAEGKLVGAVHVTRDISERKKAEKTIRENEERFRHIFEQSPLGIGLATADGKVIRVNKAMEVITGYFEEELKRINLADTYENPEDREKLLETIKRYGCAIDVPVRMVRKDGTAYDALLNVSRVKLGGRELFQTICMDVTERKKVQEALWESERMYRMLFEQASDYILVLEIPPNGIPIIRDVNSYALHVHGYTREELIDKPITLLDKEVNETVIEERKQHFLNNETATFEVKHYRKDGSVFEVEVSARKVEIGSKAFVISIERDITERKRAEEKLNKSEERFRSLATNSPVGIFQADVEGKNVYSNKSVCRFTGLKQEELYGDGWVKALHPDDRERVYNE